MRTALLTRKDATIQLRLYYQCETRPLKFREDCVNSSLLNALCNARRIRCFQLSPYTGIAAPCISFASGLHRNRITWAISSGLGHLEKSAFGMALRLGSVSMMLGSTEFTRTP